jgi:glycine cleavage system aminomethyltransferase T
MTSDTTPFEVGLERCISRTKASFTGRDPLLAAFGRKPPRLLRAFVADEALPLSGAEVLHWNGTPCSIATSSAFSFRYGKPIVYAHVPIGIASTEGFSLESFGQIAGAKALDLKELRANPGQKPDGA